MVKQYKHLFEIDGIDLEFDDAALVAIANLAIERETGARGLRAIFETMMRDIMYEAPSIGDSLEKVIIHENVITNHEQPTLVYSDKAKAKSKKSTDESA